MTAPDERSFERAVGDKADRKRRARTRRDEVWFWVGMFGLVGWSVAIPTVAGVFLGRWLDERTTGGTASWTLSLLLAGAALGCVNAWVWVRRQLAERDPPAGPDHDPPAGRDDDGPDGHGRDRHDPTDASSGTGGSRDTD